LLQLFSDLPATGCAGLPRQLVPGSHEISWWEHVKLTDDIVQLAPDHVNSHPREI
jgi:hypothetical protein